MRAEGSISKIEVNGSEFHFDQCIEGGVVWTHGVVGSSAFVVASPDGKALIARFSSEISADRFLGGLPKRCVVYRITGTRMELVDLKSNGFGEVTTKQLKIR